MKIVEYIKKNGLAFSISALYVILGGIVACSLYPDDPLNGDWWFLGWLITLPVNIVSTAYRATASQNYLPILFIQLLIFTPTFVIVSKVFAMRKIKELHQIRLKLSLSIDNCV